VSGQTNIDNCAPAFARYLEAQGDLSTASVEYLRAASCLRRGGQRADAREFESKAASCLYRSRRYEDCLRVISFPDSEFDEPVSLVLASRALMRLDRNPAALRLLDRARELSEHDPRALGEVSYLTGIAQLSAGDERAAGAWWEQTYSVDSLHRSTRIALDRLHSIPAKSPASAAVLGLIPGAGYWRAGYPAAGVTTLLTVGLSALAASIAHHRGQASFAGYMYGLSAVWYGGSVYGSYQSAGRWNAWRLNSTLDQMDY